MVLMFGTELRCLFLSDTIRTEYAAKYIKKKRLDTSRRGVAMEDIEKEIHILAEMEHENIIYLHQVLQSHQADGLKKHS